MQYIQNQNDKTFQENSHKRNCRIKTTNLQEIGSITSKLTYQEAGSLCINLESVNKEILQQCSLLRNYLEAHSQTFTRIKVKSIKQTNGTVQFLLPKRDRIRLVEPNCQKIQLTLFPFLGFKRNADSFFKGQLNSKQAGDLQTDKC